MSVSVGHLSPVLGSSPQLQFCCPKVAPERLIQDCYNTVLQIFLSSPMKISLLYIKSSQSLPFLVPAGLTHFVARPSHPPCQIIPWSHITTAKQLQFEFPLHLQLLSVLTGLSVMTSLTLWNLPFLS